MQSILGKGSMGVVYCAHDPQLDRTVAVKTILHPAGLNPYQRDKRTQSLLNEARLAARLNHPGIVRVYDAGEQDGEPYVVLERVEGRTLAEELDGQGAMPVEAAYPLLRQLFEAVAHAHDQGLVHRDLKPANIMLQPDGKVRIMDFGIAQLVGDARNKTETLAGTPRYMSPEQFSGLSADMRSDVFALGVISYEILAGRRPFAQNDYNDLLKAICVQPHTPLQAHVSTLPEGLYVLVNRALAKKPSERYASARQMLDALIAACASGETAPPPAADSSSRKEIVDFILQKIARQGDFPTTMQYISAITNAARKETSSAHSIAEAILKDFALTNRILRMVNSPFYNAARRSVTTISRAVVVLGVDAVLDVASGLSIFEHFHSRCDVPRLKAQTVRALMTAFHAREIAGQLGLPDTEEAFICGMMHHLGRLIVAFYFPEEFGAIEQMTRQGLMDEANAARKVMRITFNELGEAIAQQWRLPDSVLKCCRGLNPTHKGPLKTPEQVLQGVVSMASELSKATMIPDEGKRQAAQAAVARQFADQIRLTPRQISAVTEKSIRNAWDISSGLRVNLKDLGMADSLLGTSDQPRDGGGTRGGSINDDTTEHDATVPPDAPAPFEDASFDDDESETARQEFLLQTMNEITSMLMGSYQLNDVLMMVLEGMYRGVGAQHVLLALVNPQRTHIMYRFGLGPDTDQIRRAFHAPLSPVGGLAAVCILEGREVFVADLSERRNPLPPDLLELLNAKSLLMLPIVIRDTPIGLFVLDRSAEQPAINKHDLLNLRNLANQAVLAIKQCQVRR